MAPVIPPAAPLTEFQKHALALFIKKKRSYYQKKDDLINQKYRWLEHHNQRDPDLEGIEISEASLEQLKKKRQDLSEEKHRLFEKLKSLLPPTEDEETTADAGFQPNFGSEFQSSYPPPPSYNLPPSGHQTPSYSNYYNNTSGASYNVVTEPVTPKKPSEMSPVHNTERHITKPSEMSPVSYGRAWDNVSPVNKTNEETTPFSGRESYPTPRSAGPATPGTRETRIDSFTKAFTDTISKAKMSELYMNLENANTAKTGDEKLTSVELPPRAETEKKAEISDKPEAATITTTPTTTTTGLLSPKKYRDTPGTAQKRTPEVSPVPLLKTPETKKTDQPAAPEFVRQPKTPDPSRTKTPDTRRSDGKSRKSVSGTESNSSISSKQQSQRKEDEELPPVIKISKAEIHSKVMSWPTSHPFQRKGEEKKGKKEADNSGSSLLEFAFQSALFGNTLYNEASPSPVQGSQSAPPAAATAAPPAPAAAVPTPQSAPSDLLAALSMSYGGTPKKAAELKTDAKCEERKDQEKSRKRVRSPEQHRSPSPELVTVYKTNKEPGKPEEEKKTPPPPPPPPPPPKTTVSKKLASPAPSMQGYTPCSPGHTPFSSYHSPVSFLSPTHVSQYPSHSPIRSPMMYSTPAYPPPHSPRIGMLPPPPLPRQPIPGIPPHIPLPPPHLPLPPHKSCRQYPNNRYL